MEKRLVINANLYTGSEVIRDGFILHDEKVIAVGKMTDVPIGDYKVVDVNGRNVIPGMIDVHIHGGYDVDAMDGDTQGLCTFSNELLNEGVTSFFATTMTQDFNEISKSIKASVDARGLGANIEGIHVEGPFVSKERAGAQPLEYIVPPNLRQMIDWYDMSNGLVKLVTFAPEEQSEGELELFFEEKGIVGSAGHCDATYDFLATKKVKHYTHLYNQMRGLHHREPGVVGRALLDENAYVEIIPDGIHIHPEMVKLAYRLKGSNRVCVITDAMRAKGLKDGEYELGGQAVFVHDNRATLKDGTLAGSVLKMDQAFRNIMKFTDCSVEDAVRMTSINQAEQFGLAHKGEIKAGKDADFLIMNNEWFIETTVSSGNYTEVK